jgi:SNF2 family DNA or RNA helicase
MIKFRNYQTTIINEGIEILNTHRFLYLAMEVRTGKTLISLGACEGLGVKNVLFITKKKAISSIEKDYNSYNPSFNLTVINYESLHKMKQTGWDVVICDEAHGMGAFPKPSGRAKKVSRLVFRSNPYVILLSGTPTPESYSQMYHQVSFIPNNPFIEYRNFYAFAGNYVGVVRKKIGGMYINDYSKGNKTILDKMRPYTIRFSQKEAGFVVQTKEHILEVEMKESTYNLIKKLKKDLVVEGKNEVILADTAVKLMTKVHQMCSGTIKFESGNSMVLDFNKAEFIREKFKGKKIGIFYKFKQELNAIKQVFGDDVCQDLECFNTTDKNIALQIVSGREGISLRNAKALVYYNIDFSATSYWQSRDRMTTKDRLKNDIYWIFSKGGIEKDIYKAVVKKKDYTLTHFRRDLVNL